MNECESCCTGKAMPDKVRVQSVSFSSICHVWIFTLRFFRVECCAERNTQGRWKSRPLKSFQTCCKIAVKRVCFGWIRRPDGGGGGMRKKIATVDTSDPGPWQQWQRRQCLGWSSICSQLNRRVRLTSDVRFQQALTHTAQGRRKDGVTTMTSYSQGPHVASSYMPGHSD